MRSRIDSSRTCWRGTSGSKRTSSTTLAHAVLLAAISASAQDDGVGRMVQVPGGRIYVEDHGGPGTPMVLLHATTGSTRLWEKQVGAFKAAGLRVITYDRLGFGRSELADGVTELRPVEELESP